MLVDDLLATSQITVPKVVTIVGAVLFLMMRRLHSIPDAA